MEEIHLLTNKKPEIKSIWASKLNEHHRTQNFESARNL